MTGTQKSQGYLLAVVLTMVVLAARYLAIQPLGEQTLLLPFALSVTIAAWRGGLGPGLVATAVATVSAMYLLIPPVFSLSVTVEYLLDLLLFVVIGVVISALWEALHKAKAAEVENRFRILADCIPQLVWIATPSGTRTWSNRQWYEFTGAAAGTLEGAGWQQALATEESQAVVGRWNHAREIGEPWEDTVQLKRSDGTLRWFLSRSVPVRDEHGELRHWFGTCTDISQRKELEFELQQLNQTLEQRVASRTEALQLQKNEVAEAQQKLVASSSVLQSILDTAPDAVITIDGSGSIVGANRATTHLFDYSEEELIGRNVSLLMPAPYCDEHDGYLAKFQRTREPRIIGVGREVIAKRKDGSTFPCELAVSQVDHLNLFTGILRDITERKEMQREILEIAAEEDRRIGQELHDSTQQQLTGLGLLSQSLAENLANQALPEARTADRIAQGIKEAASEVHQLSRGLVPVDVDAEGLRAALMSLAERITEQYAVDCHCRFAGTIDLTDNFIATHLFRIAQEAVNNALKHGRSEQIELAVSGDCESVTLSVIDRGVGITLDKLQFPGTGIRTMRHRAGLVGASFQIESEPGGGTIVRCQLPQSLRKNHESQQLVSAAAQGASFGR
jgi:PAS domain S-box-containing protein